MLIGIIGRKGAGKDVAGAHLVERHEFARAAFADTVKLVAQDLFPHLTREQLYGPIAVKEALDVATGVTPRWILQKVGTEVGRMDQADVFLAFGISQATVRASFAKFNVVPGLTAWIDALFANLGDGHFVVTDVRFPNEASSILDRRGHVIKITRPGFDTGAFNDHPSESEVDNCPFDWLVVNDGSIEDLREKVDGTLTHVRRHA